MVPTHDRLDKTFDAHRTVLMFVVMGLLAAAGTAARPTTAELAEPVPAPESLHVVTTFEPVCSATGTET